MADIPRVEHRITARVPELGNPATTIEVPLTVRVDPLTGHTTRIVTGTKLAPAASPDLTPFARPPAFCPFCEDKINLATGTFPVGISDEGRIRRGVAAVVPNVLAYSEHSSVGVYDTTAHFLDLPELTTEKVADLLRALVSYTRGVHGVRPMWSSINANCLPPAGSSIPHPHAQSAHDDVGTTEQRRLVTASQRWAQSPDTESYWTTLIRQEEDGPRWIGQYGERVAALTPWAPIGFHEVWGIVDGAHDLVDLADEDCAALGELLSHAFRAYHRWNLASFNWALYGGGPVPSGAYSVLLRVVSRSNPDPLYRSDVAYFEKLHAEAVLDMAPEEVATGLREVNG